MVKQYHEIRDPIHNFIRLDSHERKVLNSVPFQRLRYIHQLGLTYLVYPGATHRRFEHSLGVMELASRVYDVITNLDNICQISDLIKTHVSLDRQYWRRVLRMAALCHDLGHLPFSHTAEKDLLPEGWNHERITSDIIRSDEMKQIWDEIKVQPDDIAKIAVGHKIYKDKEFSDWEAILSEIITGNSFGVDRMDYLLRDTYHAGVAYGKFDHYRLIDTIRILPKKEEGSIEPALGIEKGGLQSAEALLLARYFMFTQLYFHDVRRIYDIHLRDFLKEYFSKHFHSATPDYLLLTDNDILVELFKAARDETHVGHDSAKRIVTRDHFKLLYERNPIDFDKNPDAATAIFNAACKKFGEQNVRLDTYRPESNGHEFPVLTEDNRIVSSLRLSETLKKMPLAAVDYVFIHPKFREEGKKWIHENIDNIIRLEKEEKE